MAKLKMKKYPRKPKRSASVRVKENYIKRYNEVKKENAKRAAQNKKSENLSNRISGM